MASEPKTKPTDASVADFIAAVEHPRRRADAEALQALMAEASGEPAVMWGPSIIGYGTMQTGTGDWPIVGLSPRKGALTLYVLNGVDEEKPLLDTLGPHTTGVACLYLKKLDGVDFDVLEQLVRLAWERES